MRVPRAFWFSIPLMLLLEGCAEPPPPPTYHEVLSSFGMEERGATPQNPVPLSLPALDLYIDGSMSMRPFVTTTDSSYRRVLRQVVEKATTARYALNVYRFSRPPSDRSASAVTQVRNFRISQLLSPDLYDGSDTPLAGLLSLIAAGSQRNRLSLIVSDLVQSERGEDQISLVRTFHQILASRPEVLLMAFRSRYQGKYPFETPPGGTLDFDLPDDPKQGRPFYLLLIAPSANDLGQLRKSLGLIGGESFYATRPPFAVTSVQFVPSESSSAWSRYSTIQILPAVSGLRTVVATFVKRGRPQVGKGNLKLRINGQATLPFVSPDHLHHTIQRVSFRSGKLGTPKTIGDWQPNVGWSEDAEKLESLSEAAFPESVRDKIHFDPAKKLLIARGFLTEEIRDSLLKMSTDADYHRAASALCERSLLGTGSGFLADYMFERPAPASWEVYRIQMSAGKANLEIPEWGRKWSTDDDSKRANGNRTRHLQVLLGAMIRNMTESVVFLDQFILLGGGD